MTETPTDIARNMQRAMRDIETVLAKTRTALHDRLATLAGIPVVVSPYMPTRPPTPGEWACRYVRHGMADILEWLGEEVGPLPDEQVQIADAFIMRAEDRGTYAVLHPRAYAKIAQGTA